MTSELVQFPTSEAPGWDEAEFQRLLVGLAAAHAPGRFAICTEVGLRDAEIIAWGLDFGNGAVVIGPGMVARCGSVERAGLLFGRAWPVRLVRVDPPNGGA